MLNPLMNAMMQGIDMRWTLLAQVVIWIVVIEGVVLIVREITETIRARQETPLAVVQRRLANGEISRDEYEIVWHILTHTDEPDTQHAPVTTPRIPT